MKTDCFGFNPANGKCRALNTALCRKGECPFYKQKDTEERELLQINGTTDLDRIVRAYERERYIIADDGLFTD